jgi:para-nitrobenzyl esterase
MRFAPFALCAVLATIPVASFAQAAPTAPAAASTVDPATLPGAAQAAKFTTNDTPIGDILDNPAAKAVVSKYLPDMMSNDQVQMARGMTLKSVQQYSADTVTDKVLAEIDGDFVKLATK